MWVDFSDLDWVERKWLQNEGASAVVSGTTPQDPIVNCLENKNIKRNHDFDLTTINQASKQAKSSKQSINHSLYDHLWKINSFFCTSCSAGTKTAKFAGIEDGTMATCLQAFWRSLETLAGYHMEVCFLSEGWWGWADISVWGWAWCYHKFTQVLGIVGVTNGFSIQNWWDAKTKE